MSISFNSLALSFCLLVEIMKEVFLEEDKIISCFEYFNQLFQSLTEQCHKLSLLIQSLLKLGFYTLRRMPFNKMGAMILSIGQSCLNLSHEVKILKCYIDLKGLTFGLALLDLIETCG